MPKIAFIHLQNVMIGAQIAWRRGQGPGSCPRGGTVSARTASKGEIEGYENGKLADVLIVEV